MAEHQGEPIGHLAAGLAAHGFLAPELGAGQGQFVAGEGLLQQPLPFIQQLAGGLEGPFRRAGEVEHKGSRPQAGRMVHAHVVGEAMLLAHGHKQATRHADAQVAVQQPQGQALAMAQGHGGGPKHQHQLFGVLVAAGQALGAAGLLAGGRPGGVGQGGLGGPAPGAAVPGEQLLQVGGGLAGQHQHGPLAPQLAGLLAEAVPADRRQLGLHPEGIVAIGTVAIELLAQAVMGQLEGIFAVTLQGLQVELALQVDLVVQQPGLLHQGQQQGQQRFGIGRGALKADQQAVFGGLAAQASAQAFHLVGQGLAAVVAAAAAEQAGQQLVAAPLAPGVGAAAAPDPELGRHNLGARSPHHPQGAAPGQNGPGPGTGEGPRAGGRHGAAGQGAVAGGWVSGGRGAGVGGHGAHAGRARRQKARSGSSRGVSSRQSRWGSQWARASRGAWIGWCRPQRWLLPSRPATEPAASRPKR